jgi:hypothetical protein
MSTAAASSRIRRNDLVQSDPHYHNEPDRNVDLLQIRKRELEIQRLKLAREIIEGISTTPSDSWKIIIQEVLEAGIPESILESELAASRNTIYKWKNGLSSPREMTRRLLKKALVEVLDRFVSNDRQDMLQHIL